MLVELPVFLRRFDAVTAPFFWSRWSPSRLWTFWLFPSRPFAWLFFRVFLALYAIVVSSIDRAISSEPSHRYIAFLTLQGVWITVCYLTCNALVNLCVSKWPFLRDVAEPPVDAPPPSTLLPPLARAAWVGLVRATQLLFCIAVPFESSIVLLYWLLLRSPQPNELRFWDNIESHGIKLLILFIDLGLSSMTLPDPHVVVLCGALIGYLITNCWVSLTEKPVYAILTWRSAGDAVLVIGSCVLARASFTARAQYAALSPSPPSQQNLPVLFFFFASLVAYWRDRLAKSSPFQDEREGYNGPCVCCCRSRQLVLASAQQQPSEDGGA